MAHCGVLEEILHSVCFYEALKQFSQIWSIEKSLGKCVVKSSVAPQQVMNIAYVTYLNLG